MQELYLAPFRAAVRDAGALGVMSSYNDYDGVPVSASSYFLTDILRGQWGFRGYVVSDSRAVEFVYEKHHVAPDYKDAVRQVVEAGLNVRTDFTSPAEYILPLRELVREGRLSTQTLDARVRDVLRVKFCSGCLIIRILIRNARTKVSEQRMRWRLRGGRRANRLCC
jgi:beta-glucosidase